MKPEEHRYQLQVAVRTLRDLMIEQPEKLPWSVLETDSRIRAAWILLNPIANPDERNRTVLPFTTEEDR